MKEGRRKTDEEGREGENEEKNKEKRKRQKEELYVQGKKKCLEREGKKV